jgi:putative membrane protein
MPGGGSPALRALVRTVLTIAVGVGLLVWFLFYAGLDSLHEKFATIGWLAPLVLLPYVAVSIVDSMSWRNSLAPECRAQVPFHVLLLSRMAGEAVNSVTPTATVGGEPLKAQFLRAYGVPMSDGLASVVVAKTALTIAQSLFTAMGVAGLFLVLDRAGLAAFWLVALTTVLAGFAYLLVHLQRRNPATALWRWAARVFPRGRFVQRLGVGARALDQRLQDFYHGERDAFVRAASWNFLGWLFGVVEVKLMCTLIDQPIPWLEAFVIEAVAQPIRAVAIIIPGGLGIQEWGGAEFCKFLGMPVGAAGTLWLLKRGREIVFDLVGLLYLAARSLTGTLHG